MKSLSRLRLSHKQLKPWDITEFDVDLTDSPKEIDKEQILALFQNGDVDSFNKPESGSHSAFHPAGANLTLSDWQPREIDIEPELEVNKEWIFIESKCEPSDHVEPENWMDPSDAEKESTALLKYARAQAEEIVNEARVAADRLFQQAQNEIMQEKERGHQQGRSDACTEMQEALRTTSAIVDEMRKWQAEFMSQGEKTIIEMLKEIAQTMFGEGVHLDADALQINLNRIMENAQRLGDLNIFLNPRDANLLDPSWKEYQFLISGNKVRVISSEKITPGGCIVKGITGMVDGRVETQLAAIMSTFDEMSTVER